MRHRKMVAPIVSVKHYVARSNTTVATSAILSVAIVDSVAAPNALGLQVREGSVVKAIHFELWVGGNEAAGTTSQFTVMIEKMPAQATQMTFTQSQNLNTYPNKKNILYTTQGQLTSQNDGGQSIPVIRGWVLIPKGKQRMGLGDQVFFHVAAVGSIRVCGETIYKEYR